MFEGYDWNSAEAEEARRKAEDDRLREAVCDAYWEEDRHHIERATTFLAYFLFSLIAFAVFVWQWASSNGHVQWYTPVAAVAAVFVAFACAVLWVNGKMERGRLKKLMKRLRPDWQL